MDGWGFEQLRPWLARRVEMPVGTLFCVIDGQTRGRPWTPAAARNHLRRIAAEGRSAATLRATPWGGGSAGRSRLLHGQTFLDHAHIAFPAARPLTPRSV